MSLPSPDSNGIGRYLESITIGTWSTYINKGLDSVSAALTTLFGRRELYTYRPLTGTALNAIAGMRTGDLALRLDQNIIYRYNGAAWKPWESDWTTYAATFTFWASGTGGAALNSSQYKLESGRLHLRSRQILGTSGGTISSNLTISIPAGFTLRAPMIANELIHGRATLFDTGVASYMAHIRYDGTNVDRVGLVGNAATAGGTTAISNVAPFTWAAGDGWAMECELDLA